MKEFKTFQQALDYQRICPLCRHYNRIDRRESIIKSNSDYGSIRNFISWETSDNKLSIDMETGAVIAFSITENRNVAPVYTIGSNTAVTYVPSHSRSGYANGHVMERMIVGCENCYQYDYVVQVVVKIESPPTVSLFLNSESLTLDEGSATHEIRNVYSFEKTEYNKFVNTGSFKPNNLHGYVGGDTVSLPLIPLDLENPYKTLERIKTLVLFS